MTAKKCADYYAMTMHELDWEEGKLEGKLAALREARRELINRTGVNKRQPTAGSDSANKGSLS